MSKAEATTKGAQIEQLLAKHPEYSRSKIAELVGCTVQRVGEVVRASGKVTTPKAKTSKPAKSSAKVDEVASKRDDKANYDAIMAGQEGNFDAAVAYAKRTKKRTPKRVV